MGMIYSLSKGDRRMRSLILFLLCTATVFAQDGAGIYKARCAACHDNPAGRVPPVSALRAMTETTILQALETGAMQKQGEGLTIAERHMVTAYLASPAQKPAAPASATAFCPGQTQSSSLQPSSWKGWGADPANTRFQDATEAGITAADVAKLKLKWAFGLGEGTAVRAQVAVAREHVFVANLTGQLFSLDARTGCIQWTFEVGSPLRSGVVFGAADRSGKQTAVYFGDVKANAYAVDASTGQLLWKVHVADHAAAMITGAPQLHKGVLYVPVSSYEEVLAGSPAYECCTFRGSVVALDAATGKTLWTTYTIPDSSQPTGKSKTGVQMRGPSGAGVWSTPTFDEKRNVLYVSTGDNYSSPPTATSDAILALDAGSGKLLWSKQVTTDDVYNVGPNANGRDFDFGQPPILATLPNGRRVLVIGQKSGLAHALDPDREGEILWQTRLGQGGALGGIEWGSAADRENMYVAVSDVALSSVPDQSVPGGHRQELDPNHGGGLFALRLASGERVWSAKPASCGQRNHCSPAQSAAVTAIAGVVFSGSVDGHLRAYSATTGEVLWDQDTVHEYETVNGQKANGGSLDVAGPVISQGILYVNSGYGQWGGMPGNVLLAFTVDGQ
jgi:polyvinyl alcohol dehydrogenase (cytochrome)